MKTFYSVEWNGGLFRWDLAKEDHYGKWYYRTSLLELNEADEWKFIDNVQTSMWGISNLSDEFISEKIMNGKFFLNIEDAKVRSKKLWDTHFAPNDMWQVVEIFDDVEIKPISKPMPKVQAKKELEKHINRPYVSYEIRKV